MTKARLLDNIRKKNSYLCVGLDVDLNKIPRHLLKEKDPVFAFNRQIIDATADHCVAFKPNIAFYEALGPGGWESLAKTVEYIPGDIFTIADAKRGDIGNTAGLYARAFFETLDFDSITVAPYMGHDSVMPFLEFEGKWVILLAHTSNAGSQDFQLIRNEDSGRTLFAEVIEKSKTWGSSEQIMYVVGATQADRIAEIRKMAPDHFFLVPGVGAQGGDLQAVSREGMNAGCGLLVNNTRAIIYASSGTDFASMAKKEAFKMHQEMERYLEQYLPA